MPMSNDLFLAILSMDAYNREYNAGILLDGDSIGTASIVERETLITSAEYGEWQAADFYASTYEWNGETIISYRGTDNFLYELPSVDLPIAINDDYDEAQVHLASSFFKAVEATSGATPIKLTGHSLGGALAGFVGGVYDKETLGFDSIGFFPALQDFQALIDQYRILKGTPEASTHTTLPPGSTHPTNDLRNTVEYAEEQLTAMGISLTDLPPLGAHSTGTYTGAHASGEVAVAVRFGSTPSTAILGNLLPNMGSIVGPADAHSVSFAVILEYVKEEFSQNTEALQFQSIINPLFDALFDAEIAETAGSLQLTGISDQHTKMRDAIAYSALEKDGQGNGLVFGNAGIKALFDDANELGKQITEGRSPTAHANADSRLAEAIVQFAGQMALNKVDYTQPTDKEPEKGFLSVYGGDRVLKADLSKGLWNLGGLDSNKAVEIKGMQAILSDFFMGDFFTKDPSSSALLEGMQQLYGDNTIANANVINRMDFALGTEALIVQMEEPEVGDETSEPNTTSLFVGLGTIDEMKGNRDNNMVLGKGDSDQLYGNAGKDILVGGEGDDTLYGGSGDDWLHGGDRVVTGAEYGEDTADYSKGDGGSTTPNGITITFNLSASVELEGNKSIVVSDDGYGDTDHLFAVEKIKGTEHDDTVNANGGDEVFDAANYALSTGTLEVDGKDGDDTLDFSNFSGTVEARQSNGDVKVGDVTFQDFEIIKDTNDKGLIGEGTGFSEHVYTSVDDQVKEIHGNGGDDLLVLGTDGEVVDGGSGEDLVVAIGASQATLRGGSEDDIILSFGGQGNKLFGGGGNDIIWSTTFGAEVQGDAGEDTFILSRNTLIADAAPEDRISFYGLWDLTGGVKFKESEYQWATNPIGFIRYGKNADGELVIWSPLTGGTDANPNATFVANAKVDPTVPFADRTAGLLVVEVEIEVKQGWEGWSQGLFDFFETFFGFYMKAMTGESYFAGVDPLVLDLDGDGLELTARTSQSPLFDLDGDGFAEQTGWVQSDDGLLVHDLNANGEIDDVRELFGSPTTSGFDELAVHDINTDGVIDSNDAIFSDLRVWQDLNQNAKVDAGELSTLTEAGIESISLTATASNVNNANNLIAEVGSFTRTDNTTSDISDVKFKINNYDSKWLGFWLVVHG